MVFSRLTTLHFWIECVCVYSTCIFVCTYMCVYGIPRWLSGKEYACQCRRHKRRGFDPWLGKIPWRRKWQLAPVFLPERSHRQRSLMGYSPWSRKESDMTEHRHVYVYVYTYIYVPMYLYVCLCAYRYTEIASRLFMFVYKCPSQPFFPLTNHHLTANISQLRSSSSVKCSR